LEALFSGRWDKKLLRDNCGRIFLDVNPKAFRAIVDWLNVLVISSEDDSPPAPSVDEEHKYILSDHIKLFLKNRAVTHIDSKIINSVNEEEIIHDWLREDGSVEISIFSIDRREMAYRLRLFTRHVITLALPL
jgi:hypothetical protein